MVSVQIAALVAALSATGETALLDFQAPWCAPCRAMAGTLAELERSGYPIRRVNVDVETRLARQFNVHSVPCFVMVVDGREVARHTGAARRDELVTLFDRAGYRPGRGKPAIARAQSPDPSSGGAVLATSSAAGPSGFESGAAPTATGGAASATGQLAGQRLVDASVRLTITDEGGASHGTGTLIDARQGEALVLTCGHIFRDSKGQGQIAVDLCAPGGRQALPGRLISYDLESDVALVSIRPGGPVQVAPVAPKGYRPAKGDRVTSVGCNHGHEATAEQSTITAVNKFRAPPNLSVAGLPVQGRSGGGLFAADGHVIGVCNAADPTDNEGLYAALAVIHTALDQARLSAVYEHPSRGSAAPLAQSAPPAAAPSEGAAPAAEVEMLPSRIGTLAEIGPGVLSELADRADGAEVICIVRPLDNPQARSEVIMLDRASTAFLRQLSADRQAQAGRHLTSLKTRATPPPRPGR